MVMSRCPWFLVAGDCTFAAMWKVPCEVLIRQPTIPCSFTTLFNYASQRNM